MFSWDSERVSVRKRFSRIQTEYEEIRSICPYSVRMRKNAGKNADQNNSEYGLFLGSVYWERMV